MSWVVPDSRKAGLRLPSQVSYQYRPASPITSLGLGSWHGTGWRAEHGIGARAASPLSREVVHGDGDGTRTGCGRGCRKAANAGCRCRPSRRGREAPGGPKVTVTMAGTVHAVVTNDDGIGSEGLRMLAYAAVRAGWDVVVAAPDREASG